MLSWTGHLHSLDPLGTRWSRLKRVTEILGLADNLFILKFHDTHRIRWLPIFGKQELFDLAAVCEEAANSIEDRLTGG